MSTATELEAQITAIKASLVELKAQNNPNNAETIKKLGAELTAKKSQLDTLTAADKPPVFNRAALDSLLLKRFFYAPSFSIYGGIAGLFDYGPPGCSLQNNILQTWRNHFVLEEDMLELDCTNLTPESVLKTSGHVERFADYMVNDTVTGDIFRADHVVKQVLTKRLEDDGISVMKKGAKKPVLEKLASGVREEYELTLEQLDNYVGDALHELIQKLEIRAPETGNELTKPALFNLMFETQIGPTGQFKGYLRPETAQGHFLNFKKLLEYNTEQIPFASAMIGKSFRNEISPRQGLLRVREFTMAEIEHFVDPLKKSHPRFYEVKDTEIPFYPVQRQLENKGVIRMTIGEAVEKKIVDNETLGYFIARIYLFLLRIGIDPARLRLRQHMQNEMAHYACDCWDAEIESSYGWIECVGCADRSAYDLTVHAKKTNDKLIAREILSDPIIKLNQLVLEVNAKKIGPTFKKDAKHVNGFFDSLKSQEADDEWDQVQLGKFRDNLQKGNATIVGTDGKKYSITNDMVTVTEKTIKKSVREFTPNVIEPSFGIGRILYSLIEHSYYIREGDEQRGVLAFKPIVAPTKVLIVPISHQDEFLPIINKLAKEFRRRGISNKVDDSGVSIGKRYSRNDELGTPFAITIDFETLNDDSVTIRERDTTKQVRVKFEEACDIIDDLCAERKTWNDVLAAFKNVE